MRHAFRSPLIIMPRKKQLNQIVKSIQQTRRAPMINFTHRNNLLVKYQTQQVEAMPVGVKV